MISSVSTAMVAVMVSLTSTTQAHWVPDEAYMVKRAEPTKSDAEGPSKTSTPKKETSAKPATSKKEEPSKATTSKHPTSKTTSKESKPTSNDGSSSPASGSAVVPTFVGTTPSAAPSTISPSATPSSSPASSGSPSGAIIGGVVAGVAAIVGICAFVLFRKRKARQNARANLKKPDPFTMGFGSDDPKYYNNNFPPQQNNTNNTYQNQTSTFDNYEVAAISPSNKQAIQQSDYQPYQTTTTTNATTAAAPIVAQYEPHQPSLGSFIVIATYIPTLSDELEIETGDQIDLLVEYDDGWCQGVNITKGHTKGVFPRHCIDYATAPSNHVPNTDVERSKRVSSMYKP